MKEVIIINGPAGSGKDEFIKIVNRYAKVRNFSSVDKVKSIATLIGWQGQKDEKSRKFLSDLKRLTTEYNDMSYNDMMRAFEEFKSSDEEIMFIHIREPEEIRRAVKLTGAKTLFIDREGVKKITSNPSDAHVDDYTYDMTIINTTLDEYQDKAEAFVESLRKENREEILNG